MVFRPYPQLIQRFFNTNWFGPPLRVTGGSAWPRIDHPASGLPGATRRAIRTRFRFGFAIGFASPRRTTRRLIMQKARGRGSGPLPQFADGWFQVLFHSPRGVLFTFPSRYLCAIGRQLVFSLGGWAPRIRTGFHVSRPTQGSGPAGGTVSRTGLSPSPARLSRRLLCRPPDTSPALQPRGMNPPVWASPRSLAATGGISFDFFSSGY